MTGTEGLVSCSFRFVPCFAFAVCLFAVFFSSFAFFLLICFLLQLVFSGFCLRIGLQPVFNVVIRSPRLGCFSAHCDV